MLRIITPTKFILAATLPTRWTPRLKPSRRHRMNYHGRKHRCQISCETEKVVERNDVDVSQRTAPFCRGVFPLSASREFASQRFFNGDTHMSTQTRTNLPKSSSCHALPMNGDSVTRMAALKHLQALDLLRLAPDSRSAVLVLRSQRCLMQRKSVSNLPML